MLQIAICDDLSNQLQQIKTMVDIYFEEKPDCPYGCKLFDNPFLFLEDLVDGNNYDLLLLDICMPGISGTDIAKEVRKRKDKTAIIFLTTSAEFAVEAFSLQASNYLVKPFSKQQFFDALDRVIPTIRALHNKKIVIKLTDGTCTIDCNDIVLVESEGHILHIYMTDGECLQTRCPLKDFSDELAQLTGEKFMNPYKGFLVNQDRIKVIKENIIKLEHNFTVPISKHRFGKLKKQYFDYIFSTR